MYNINESFALITGASQGLGREFAMDLARKGINVLLTALPNEDLDLFCTKLRIKFHIKADYLECDLTSKDEIKRLVRWIKENYAVSILINNVGVGGTAEFEKTDTQFIDNMILLNVRATALLTRLLLPMLHQNKPAWVLNVASMASLSPMGYKTVYPATKAFILNFSRGLHQELKDSGIFVSVVLPGAMKTNEDCTHRIEKQGWLAKAGLLSPEIMAKRSIEKLFQKDPLILVGWMNKVHWFLMKSVPSRIGLPVLTQIMKREMDTSKEKIKHHESIGYRRKQLAGSQYDR